MSSETVRRPILVADDDPDILRYVADLLSRAGHDVLTAADGTQALELARRNALGLAILDISMPGLDGFQVCAALEQSRPSPPVIFLTAHAQVDSRVAGLDGGAVDYVVKPFRSAELLARVRAALRTTEAIDVAFGIAMRDGLTGLLTRSVLDVQAAEAIALASRSGRPLACVLLDLDRFKSVNDTLGHAAGDVVLRAVGAVLRNATRDSDVVGRYGGDEFALVLPDTDSGGAEQLVEHLLRKIEATPVSTPGGHRVAVRASAGIARWSPSMHDVGELYRAADVALYASKRRAAS